MQGTLNASLSSNNAAYARIKSLEKKLEALTSEVNVDSSQIEAIQQEIAKYKADMSANVTADNITATTNLTSNGSTHLKTLTADERITAIKGIDAETNIVVGKDESKTEITGNKVQTSEVSAAVISANGKVSAGRLEATEASINSLEVTGNTTINGTIATVGKASFNDVEINHDLLFPKVDSNITGEYLNINAKDAAFTGNLQVTGATDIGGNLQVTGATDIGGDLQVEGPAVIGGSLVCKDTLVAKNIMGNFVLKDINVNSVAVKNLATDKPVLSNYAVGYDNTGKLIPIKAAGGGSSGIAEAVETEVIIPDLKLYPVYEKIDPNKYVVCSNKADDDTYRVVMLDSENAPYTTTMALYHWSTGEIETLASLTGLVPQVNSGLTNVALDNDKVYYVEIADLKSIKCFNYTDRTTTTVYTSTDLDFCAFNTFIPYVVGYGISFALFGDPRTQAEGPFDIKRVVRLDNGSVVAEDAEYVKTGTYGGILIPTDLHNYGNLSYIITENNKAYWSINTESNQLLKFNYTDGATGTTVTSELSNMTPSYFPQNGRGIFDGVVDGVGSMYLTHYSDNANSIYVVNADGSTTLVESAKIRSNKVSLNFKYGPDLDLQICDENDKLIMSLPNSNLLNFTGFDTSYVCLYYNFICPPYKSLQNVLINSSTVALERVDISIKDSPITMDGKYYIKGVCYDYVLSAETDIENLLKELYQNTDLHQDNSAMYKDISIYLKDGTYLLRNSVIEPIKSNKTLYGLHFYGASKKGVVIDILGFDIATNGTAKFTSNPLFGKSSFENLSIQIKTGQFSTEADFRNCDITKTCNGPEFPFYGYSFENCELTAKGTINPGEIGFRKNYDTVVFGGTDPGTVAIIRAQFVRDCTIYLGYLSIVNTDGRAYENDLYIMVPLIIPSDAAFERNTFGDVKSYTQNSLNLAALPKTVSNGQASPRCYWTWDGVRGNRYTGNKLDLLDAKVEKFKLNGTSTYVLAQQSSIPGVDDLLTNSFATVVASS